MFNIKNKTVTSLQTQIKIQVVIRQTLRVFKIVINQYDKMLKT